MLRAAACLLVLLALLAWAGPALAEEPPTVEALGRELMCQCGCGLTVDACGGAMECSTADQMKGLIAAKLSAGEGREEILAYFQGQYGEKVLAAPKKEGFNLTAWVLPFAVIAAGGLLIYTVLTRWVASRSPAPIPAAPAQAGDLARYEERLRRELEQF